LNLSDLTPTGGVVEVGVINYSSDTTISLISNNLEIIPTTSGLTLTLPQVNGAASINLFNTSEYPTHILNSDTGKTFLVDANSSISLFYLGTTGKWLQVVSNVSESHKDIDGNNLSSSAFVFNTGATAFTSVAMLDSTHFVVAYQDYGNNKYGTAIIGTVSGTSITFGNGYVFDATDTYSTSVAMIDSTHFVVAYDDHINGYGKAIIGTVSGTSISFGSEYVFNTGTVHYTSVAMIDSTHFVVIYTDYTNNQYGAAIIGTVSGTSISFGSEYVFNADITYYPSVAAMIDSTHFIVAYNDGGNNYYGTSIIGTISGTSISFGSEYVFNVGRTHSPSIAMIDSTHFVLAYRDARTSNDYGTAIIGTISGTSISFGSAYRFNNHSDLMLVAMLDSIHFVVAYRHAGANSYGSINIGTISGSSISFDPEYMFNFVDTYYTSVNIIDSTHFVVAYQDTGRNSYGTVALVEG